jgi:hypothetical protein
MGLFFPPKSIKISLDKSLYNCIDERDNIMTNCWPSVPISEFPQRFDAWIAQDEERIRRINCEVDGIKIPVICWKTRCIFVQGDQQEVSGTVNIAVEKSQALKQVQDYFQSFRKENPSHRKTFKFRIFKSQEKMVKRIAKEEEAVNRSPSFVASILRAVTSICGSRDRHSCS